MSGYLLHVGATVQCLHTGPAQPMTSTPRVSAGGQPVTTQTGAYTVTGCTLPPPPTANGPCVTAQWVTAATRVTAGGVPVLLQDSQAVCAPTGTGLTVIATQTRVRGS